MKGRELKGKIYVAETQPHRELVRAKTAQGAETYMRDHITVNVYVPTQDELMALAREGKTVVNEQGPIENPGQEKLDV